MRSLTPPAWTVREPSGRELLKLNSRGHLCLTRERREMLLAEFDRSGASAPRFAEMTGIKYQTFIGWLAARRTRGAAKAEVKRPQALTWVEAVASPPAPAAPVKEPQTELTVPLRVHLPGGAWMEVAAAEQARTAALLLRELSTAEGQPC